MTAWTRAHERLLDAYLDLYRAHRRRGQNLRALDSWLSVKFNTELMTVDQLTVAQARQARRSLRAWGYSDGPKVFNLTAWNAYA